MKNLDIPSLRSFILAEKLGSFSNAADNLNCSQAALSFRIKKLEGSLGTQLFHRNYHHLTLTTEGKSLLPEAIAVVKAHDKMLNRAHRMEARETISLGIPEDLTRPLFKQVFAEREDLRDRLNIDLTMRLCRDLIDMVDDDQLHIVIATVPPEHYGGEQITTQNLCWVASPDFRYDPHRPIPLALHPTRCIYRDLILSVFERTGTNYRIAFSAHGSMSVQAAVIAGMGVTVIAEGMIPPELVVVPSHWNLPNLGVTDIRLFKGASLTAGQLEFANTLKEAFGRSFQEGHGGL